MEQIKADAFYRNSGRGRNVDRQNSALSADYHDFVRRNRQSPYTECLGVFLHGLLADNADNIKCVIMYGGLVRDGMAIPKWSDLDLLVVFQDILKRDPAKLAKHLQRAESQFSIRIDLTQVDLLDITDSVLGRNCFSSELLNVLALRDRVSMVLFGSLPKLSFTKEQEEQAALYYIGSTIAALRRYLVEWVYTASDEQHLSECRARVTRWVFSIVRSSLRLFGVYAHPYEDSLDRLRTLFPSLDLTILERLAELRKSPQASLDRSVFRDIEHFVQRYSVLVFRKYADGAERL